MQDSRFQHLSRAELIDQILLQETTIQQLQDQNQNDFLLNFPWTGNLGQWYWNYVTNEVHFNPLKVTTLGYTLEELPEKVGFQFFTEKIHPEDFGHIMQIMAQHLKGVLPVYECEYRIRTKSGEWKWYYDRGKVTQRDTQGKPLFLVGIVFDITRQKEMEVDLAQKNSILKEMAITDGLTGLLNHRELYSRLEWEISRSRRYQVPLSLLLFDIDFFKKINDSQGHLIGDMALIEVGRSIKEVTRD